MNEETNEMDLEMENKVEENIEKEVVTPKAEDNVTSNEHVHEHGFAITSAILGVASIAFMWILPYITLALSITGLFFAIVSLKREKDSLSYLALTANIVGLGLFLLYFIAIVLMGATSFLFFVK